MDRSISLGSLIEAVMGVVFIGIQRLDDMLPSGCMKGIGRTGATMLG